MTDNINFKEFWNNQKVETLDTKELIKKATKYKRKSLLNLIVANVITLVTSIGIGSVWYYFQPEFISTKIGIILCIIAMFIYTAFYNTLAPILLKNKQELSAKDQLQQLVKLKEKQRFQQTILLNSYFITLSLGLGLYMYEYIVKMTFTWAVFSYGIVMFWIALNAFYFRPRIIRKKQTKLNNLITQLKGLKEQLAD